MDNSPDSDSDMKVSRLNIAEIARPNLPFLRYCVEKALSSKSQ